MESMQLRDSQVSSLSLSGGGLRLGFGFGLWRFALGLFARRVTIFRLFRLSFIVLSFAGLSLLALKQFEPHLRRKNLDAPYWQKRRKNILITKTGKRNAR